jgi:hypothetical protein
MFMPRKRILHEKQTAVHKVLCALAIASAPKFVKEWTRAYIADKLYLGSNPWQQVSASKFQLYLLQGIDVHPAQPVRDSLPTAADCKSTENKLDVRSCSPAKAHTAHANRPKCCFWLSVDRNAG